MVGPEVMKEDGWHQNISFTEPANIQKHKKLFQKWNELEWYDLMWWVGVGDWFTRLRLGWRGLKRCRFDSAQRAYVFENRTEVNLIGGYLISLSQQFEIE